MGDQDVVSALTSAEPANPAITPIIDTAKLLVVFRPFMSLR